MNAQYLVGVDSGLTVTKAAVFDLHGRCLSTAGVPSPHETSPDGSVEIDAERQWRAVTQAIRTAVRDSGVAKEIAAVGVTAHGDCVYLADTAGAPVRAAIPSLDFRGAAIAREWDGSGVSAKLFAATGELPRPHHIHTTLRWLLDREPQSLSAARWVLFAKDWLKLRLTGTVTTDPTDASAGFTDLPTGRYSDEALEVCGLGELRDKLPPIRSSTDVAGSLTHDAAALTGLPEGLPVACGVHDISAAALGSGLTDEDTALLIAGTYSVSAVLVDRPQPDEDWLCRDWATPGSWIKMATSATSASNFEWVVDRLGGGGNGTAPSFASIDAEVADVIDDDMALVFHPFLFGTPDDERASAAILGLRPWHRRAHVYRAVLEGITFAHRAHLESLTRGEPVGRAVLAGGAARSAVWSQMFANALGLPIRVCPTSEVGTLGAAICAAVAIGAHDSLRDGCRAMSRVSREFEPDAGKEGRWELAYRRYRASVRAAADMWAAIEGTPGDPPPGR